MTHSPIFEGNETQQEPRVFYTLGDMEPPAICSAVKHDRIEYSDDMNLYKNEEECEHKEAPSYLESSQNSCSRLSLDMAGISPSPCDLFLENSMFGSDVYTSAQDLLCILSKSRMAQAHIDCADKYGVELKENMQITSASYDKDLCAIFYNPNMSIGGLILSIAGELRRHWQDRQGALISPLMFAPEMSLLIGRAQKADIAQMIVRVAWDLRISGEKRPWAHVESSSMADLGQAFAAEAFLDFRGLASGDTALAVFEAWFLSPRCAMADKELIHNMLSGISRPSSESSQSMDLAIPEVLRALGNRPIDDNYLSKNISSILEDPLFTEVRDRANANFLWFVKFEDCLRISEEPELRRDFISAIDADRKDFSEQTAEIVDFVPNETQGLSSENQGCEIISLDSVRTQ